jgi:hypothetical protein
MNTPTQSQGQLRELFITYVLIYKLFLCIDCHIHFYNPPADIKLLISVCFSRKMVETVADKQNYHSLFIFLHNKVILS